MGNIKRKYLNDNRFPITFHILLHFYNCLSLFISYLTFSFIIIIIIKLFLKFKVTASQYTSHFIILSLRTYPVA